MQYYGTVYRPPSEARSLIIQCTIGCAHNTCEFCSMYREKQFRMRPQEEILADLAECAEQLPWIEKLFLADGDALVMPTPRLLEIIRFSKARFPALRQITCYATARDVLRKTEEELISLREAGLDMLYIGLESGDDEVLRRMKKDLTREEFVAACKKAHAAGLKLSVTMILGLAERAGSERHAELTALAITEAKPEYAAFLSLQIEPDAPLYEDVRAGRFHLLTDEEAMAEMAHFLRHVDSEGTVFRSNHASNAVAVGGTLNRDREKMIRTIEEASRRGLFRPREMRGL